MKAKKRKLYPYEKVFVVLKILMVVVSLVFLIVYVINEQRWAICATWMCMSLAQIANSCVRWDEQAVWNKLGLCAFGFMFVFFLVGLVLSF